MAQKRPKPIWCNKVPSEKKLGSAGWTHSEKKFEFSRLHQNCKKKRKED